MGLLKERKPNIQALTRAGDVEGLVRAVHYTDLQAVEDGAVGDLGAAVRADAVRALGSLGPDAGGQAVSSALQDPVDDVRCAAVRVLHQRKATDSLVDALSWLPAEDGRSLELARRALTSLGETVDSPVAVRALVHAQDERLLGPEDLALVDALLDGAAAGRRTEVIDFLIGALADERGIVVDRAADLLVELAPQSTSALVDELGSGRAPAAAAWILGKVADPRTVEALIDALSHDRANVRAESAAALAEIGDPLAVAPLVRATRDSDQVVRTQSRMALDEFGTTAVIVGVAELLRPVVLEAGRSTGSGTRKKPAKPATTQKKKPTRRAPAKAKADEPAAPKAKPARRASSAKASEEAAPAPSPDQLRWNPGTGETPPSPAPSPQPDPPQRTVPTEEQAGTPVPTPPEVRDPRPPTSERTEPSRPNGTTPPQPLPVAPRNGGRPEAEPAGPGGDQT